MNKSLASMNGSMFLRAAFVRFLGDFMHSGGHIISLARERLDHCARVMLKQLSCIRGLSAMTRETLFNLYISIHINFNSFLFRLLLCLEL